MARLSVLFGPVLFGIVASTPNLSHAESTSSIDSPEPGKVVIGDATEASVAPTISPARGVAPPVLAQWTMGVHPSFAPVGIVLADLNANGNLEVVAGSTNDLLYAWDYTGTALPGFPVDVGGQIQSKAAVADLDGDGDLEILVEVKTGQLHIYHHDGSTFPGWPQATGFTYGFLAPSVYNLDGQGGPEVLIGGGGNVRAWYADGTPVPGWPQAISGSVTGTLAIADVIGDESPEIFAVSSSKDLYGFHADGTAVTGFPVNFNRSSSWAAPSIGDLDGNGTREICVVGYDFGVSTDLFAYEADGTLVTGFPVSHASGQTYSCPVLADIDNDDDLEIFNAGKIIGDSFFAWDHLGAVLPGWPVATGANMEGSAIVADFDGTAGGQVTVGDNSGPGQIFGFDVTGLAAAGFPVPKPGISYPNSPEVGDVDNDGDLDMAMATNGTITIWDFATPYLEDRVEWGTLFHDDWNTNQYGFVVPTTVPTAVPGPVAVAEFGSAEPNPLSVGETKVRFTLGKGDILLRAAIYDASGRKVRSLPADLETAAEQELHWDGLDDGGRPAAAGVYFFRFETREWTRSVPVAVIR